MSGIQHQPWIDIYIRRAHRGSQYSGKAITGPIQVRLV